MSDQTPRTPDDAMIRGWIASLALKAAAMVADLEYNTATDGEYVTDDDFDKHDAYMIKIATAKRALKALIEEPDALP